MEKTIQRVKKFHFQKLARRENINLEDQGVV